MDEIKRFFRLKKSNASSVLKNQTLVPFREIKRFFCLKASNACSVQNNQKSTPVSLGNFLVLLKKISNVIGLSANFLASQSTVSGAFFKLISNQIFYLCFSQESEFRFQRDFFQDKSRNFAIAIISFHRTKQVTSSLQRFLYIVISNHTQISS